MVTGDSALATPAPNSAVDNVENFIFADDSDSKKKKRRRDDPDNDRRSGGNVHKKRAGVAAQL